MQNIEKRLKRKQKIFLKDLQLSFPYRETDENGENLNRLEKMRLNGAIKDK